FVLRTRPRAKNRTMQSDCSTTQVSMSLGRLFLRLKSAGCSTPFTYEEKLISRWAAEVTLLANSRSWWTIGVLSRTARWARSRILDWGAHTHYKGIRRKPALPTRISLHCGKTPMLIFRFSSQQNLNTPN